MAMTLKDRILDLLRTGPGLTDREITDRLLGNGKPPQSVNIACRALEERARLVRRKEAGRIRNYVASPSEAARAPRETRECETDAPSNTHVKRLLKVGFRRVGQWLLQDGELVVSKLDSNAPDSPNALYVFVADTGVKYVGKTTMSVRRRLYGYQNPGPSQRTNQRNHDRIRQVLERHGWVHVYVMPDPGLHAFGEFEVNLAAGLEDSIIRKLRPEWNS